MRRSVVLLTMLVTTLTPVVGTSSAGAYDLHPWRWKSPAALRYCFGLGYHPRYVPLPTQYRSFIKFGAAGWNGSRTPVSLALDSNCNSGTHIKVWGWDTSTLYGGEGGCSSYSGGGECVTGAGYVAININFSPTQHPKMLNFLAGHEFGHALGLAHPTSGSCENRCYGPIMSYGSCPYEGKCVQAPNADDENGINKKYHYKPSDARGGGGGCLRALDGTGVVDAADALDAYAGQTTTAAWRDTLEAAGGSIGDVPPVVSAVLGETVGSGGTSSDPYATATGVGGKALWGTELVPEDARC